MNFKNKKVFIVVGLLILAMILIFKNTSIYLAWENSSLYQIEVVRSLVHSMRTKYMDNPVRSLLYFAVTYITATSLSIPIANLLSVVAGAVFGFATALPIALLCTSIGASLSSTFTRYLFREWATQKAKTIFKEKFHEINENIHEKALLYIVGLRMTMFIPFAGLNLVLGLTKIPIRTIFLATLIGQIPVAGIFINAGRSVFNINTLSDIMTLRIALTITSLAIIPILIARFYSRSIKSDSPRKTHDLNTDSRT